MYNDNTKAHLRYVLREPDAPFFDLMAQEGGYDPYEFYMNKNGGDVNATLYEMLIVKSEPSGLNVSGLTLEDSSTYFKRLASMYIQTNSGILEGG